MKYRGFLSYSHVDRKWARWLHRALESYRPPGKLTLPDGGGLPKRLNPIFRDRDELPSAASLSDAVKEALAESEKLIVVCSPSAAASQWVNEEIRTFRKLGRSADILCFVIDGEPGSTKGNDCFPEALTEPAEPGGAALEPIAADARQKGDGRKNAMLKIAAGILGVGFDALRQRDLRKRQQKLLAVTAGSLAIATLTVLLAISAFIARNEAEAQRVQAEELIDFMLGDLREQLGKIGRLDVFQSVGDKALEYFTAQRDSNVSEYTLSQRARNLRQIGEVRFGQGNLAAALEAFNESLLIMDKLADAAPGNVDTQIGLANSLFYVGLIHWQRGELHEARTFFERVIPIVDQAVNQDPENTTMLIERAYAHTNLGRVLELEGAYQEAQTAYRAVMDVNMRLVRLQPENLEWQLELGFAHNNLGKLGIVLGHLDEAEGHYRSDLQIKNNLFTDDLSHNRHRSYLAVSQYYMGQLLLARGEFTEAEALLVAAREHFVFLNEVDQKHTLWHVRRANIERELGVLFELTERTPESLEMLESSIMTLEELVHREEGNTRWRRDLTRSLLVSTEFATRHNHRVVAEQNLQKANAHIDVLLEQEPTSLETRQLSAYADVCAAMLADPASAEPYWQSALQHLDQHFPGTADPRILELKSVALAALSRNEEAAVVSRSLEAIGYRGREL